MERFTLFVHFADDEPFPISVDPHWTVADLEPALPGSPPYAFFFNGVQLQGPFTLKWFGIADGSHVHVYEAKQCDSARAPRTEQQRSRAGVGMERAKLRDQFFAKVEGTTLCYRNIIKRFMHASAVSELPTVPQSRTVVAGNALQRPATEQLPRFWSDHDECE